MIRSKTALIKLSALAAALFIMTSITNADALTHVIHEAANSRFGADSNPTGADSNPTKVISLLNGTRNAPKKKHANTSTFSPFIPATKKAISENCDNSANPALCRQNLQQQGSLHSLPLDDSGFNLSGPFSLNVIYSSELNMIGQGQYSFMLSDANAVSMLADGGSNEWRGDITLGHQFNSTNLIKLTYEYLRQRWLFPFSSKNTRQWVSQNSIGLNYEHLINASIFRSVDIMGFYSTSENKTLSPAIFTEIDQEEDQINFRHIAGGTEENADLQLNILPFNNFEISPSIGYSRLLYFKAHAPKTTLTQFDYGIITTAALTEQTEALAGYQNNVDSNQYFVSLNHILGRVAIGLTASYLNGKHGQPNNIQAILSITFPISVGYGLSKNKKFSALNLWVAEPAVYKQQVLAIKD